MSTFHQDLLRRAQQLLPGGALHLHTPPSDVYVVLARGLGSRVWDYDGCEYLDYQLGHGPLILGHAHPAVVAAASEAVAQGSHLFDLNEPILQLSTELVNAAPCGEQVKFTGSGNEATYMALRLARAYTGKSTILKFAGGFHGTHDYATWSQDPLRVAPPGAGHQESDGLPNSIADSVLVAPFNDLHVAEQLVEQYRDVLAAVIVEPYPHHHVPDVTFLRGLRACTREAGVLLIFDEIVTGFRIAWHGAEGRYGVTGDLATYGKVIGGGFPIGAVVGPAEIMDRLSPGRKSDGSYVMSSGTFSGNPVSASAGLAALEQLRQPGQYDYMEHLGQRFASGLREVAEEVGCPVHITQQGSIVTFLCLMDESQGDSWLRHTDPLRTMAFGHELLRRQVYVTPGGRFYLSLAHTMEDLHETLTRASDALKVAVATLERSPNSTRILR